METTLKTDTFLLKYLEEIKLLEPFVYMANDGMNRAHFEKLLHANFWEIAASGKRYSRSYVLDELEKRQASPFVQNWHTSNHYLQQISEELFLFSYVLHQPTRVSQRTSVWKRSDNNWLIIYHQGTVVKR